MNDWVTYQVPTKDVWRYLFDMIAFTTVLPIVFFGDTNLTTFICMLFAVDITFYFRMRVEEDIDN